jgi:hypothetical protein
MAVTPGSTRGGDALLDAMRRHPQLPGLGTSIARIVAMADSNAESIQELRNVILSDVHLTQRILGIANSAGYRLSSGAGITTVTRAIVVIGFEQVKLLALGMMFVDQLPDKERAVALNAELIQALQASLLACEMSRQLAPDDKEKAAIAALLPQSPCAFHSTSPKPVRRPPASLFSPSFQRTRQSPAFWSVATCRNRNTSVRKTCVCSERYAARLFWR